MCKIGTISQEIAQVHISNNKYRVFINDCRFSRGCTAMQADINGCLRQATKEQLCEFYNVGAHVVHLLLCHMRERR